MSLFRIANASKNGLTLLSSRAVLTSVSSSSLFRRSYWWNKKTKDDEKKIDEKKSEKETVEETKKEVPSKIAETLSTSKKPTKIDNNHDNFAVKQLDAELPNYSDSLWKSESNNNYLDEDITNIPLMKNFRDPFKSVQNFLNPRPIRLNDEMIIPAIPLPVRPLLPGFMQKLTISDRKTVQKLREIQTSPDRYIGLFLRREMSSNDISDNPDVIRSLSDIYDVGTCAELQDLRMIGSNASLVLMGRSRIRIKECVEIGPPTLIKASRIPLPTSDLDEVTMNAYANEIFSYTQQISSSNTILGEYLAIFMQRRENDNPLSFADFAGGLTTVNRELQQKLLESRSYTERFDIAIKLFSQELTTIRVQQELKQKVEASTKETERKYVMREQMKVIQQELGGQKDPKMAYIEKIEKKVEEMKGREVSKDAITAIEEELQRLQYTDIQSAEFGIIRNYIDWITGIPWNTLGTDQMNILHAQQVLNEDHYGLKDVKDRILEFIAVGKLQGHIPGKVLCFVGPPGTGKTSVAKSIARALGREYYQFSVGGANDVSQIKGHRRTYIGSMPGKLIHCLKTTKVNNPLILIDEVDKISASHQGDPASALLEVLDPNQNNAFVDNYIDIPVDFSKALFVCTANDISSVPQALVDRMEVIRISGYDYKEKLEISKNYLEKKARVATGLEVEKASTPKTLAITDEALTSLIRWYCREAGVRNLEKYIEKIYRKVAMRLATMTAEEVAATDFTVHESNLEQYVGKRIFLSDRLYDQTPAGVVMGLAWTSMGGATLYIECATIKPHPLDTELSHIVQDMHDIDGISSGESIISPSGESIISPSGESIISPSGESIISLSSSKLQTEDGNGSSETHTVKLNDVKSTSVGHLTTTGQLGDVMKESIQISYINARHWMQRLAYSQPLYNGLMNSYNAHKAINSVIPNKDDIFNILETSDLHMHLPEGATPKDGPSAGCAITTSLLSIALNRPVKQGLAMTGEISLNGKVLPVGGIKEKVMAARRAGINEIILPAENCRDVNELPDYVTENLTVHYAKTYENVLKYSELCPEIFN